jgi:hypothetical protein
MGSIPTEQILVEALSAAGSAHHDYESDFLGGARDEHWAGWYAAYVLGRLGDFTTPTTLAKWLSEVAGEGDWPKNAASHVASSLSETAS